MFYVLFEPHRAQIYNIMINLLRQVSYLVIDRLKLGARHKLNDILISRAK